MRISYLTTGAALDSVTLISNVVGVVAEQSGADHATVIGAALARLALALDEIALAIRDPESLAGRRLRQDVLEQLSWAVEAGYVREIKTEAGEVRYTTR